jgi:arylsulfatase A-like enzyme
MRNTVIVLIDSLRRDFLGCYGALDPITGQSLTPAMDALAARGARFEQHYLGSFPCMPARRDLWTGRTEFPFRGWGALEPDDPDLFARLRAGGSTTMLVTDHYHLWDPGSGNYSFGFTGWEFIRGQEYDRWITDPTIPIPWPAPEEKMAGHCPPDYYYRYQRNRAHFRVERDWFAPQVFQAATDWLERNHDATGGFSLMIDCFDPHEPFDPPPPWDTRYIPAWVPPETDKVIWPTYGRTTLTPAEIAVVRGLYAGELALTDRWLGRFLERLDDLGHFADTTVVVTTDHGHLFGEHGLVGKPSVAVADSTLYEELAHVPLIITDPEGQRGQRVHQITQTIDLFATALDAHGVAPPQGTEGRSLLPLLRGETAPLREVACYGRYGEAMQITDGEWTLVLWPPGAENGPLYWYSTLPPVFDAARASGPLTFRNGRAAYPATCPRGTQQTRLFHTATDPRQEQDVTAGHPEVAARLRRALTAWLESVNAPPEQFERLGLR